MSAGATQAEANSVFSMMSWVIAGLTLPGAILAARVTNRTGILIAGLAFLTGVIAVLALVGPGTTAWVIVIVMGVVGPLAPLIVGLPASAVPVERRAMAYGVFFTVYYVSMAFLPPLVGALRDQTGNADLPLYSASVLMLAAVGFYTWFLAARR